jgi:hypothetical protein
VGPRAAVNKRAFGAVSAPKMRANYTRWMNRDKRIKMKL